VRVIPVIDLMHGQVVRGIAGRRSEYRPIQSSIAADAQPATIARTFAQQFGFKSVYVADLDAIERRQPNVEAWKEINDAGLALWLDAGMGSPQAAAAIGQQLSDTVTGPTMIVGLESVPAPLCVFDCVGIVAVRFPGMRVAFSLDLQQGRPLTRPSMWQDSQPIGIARWVIKAGIQRLIVLDLADVGVAAGTTTLELCRAIRQEFPEVELIAGGGVRSLDDLHALRAAGCDAALVASALHDERLSPQDLREFTN
jgi:phosphoribosylformimino-5-aminoimidazole carboxamide ribotide isomerase